MKLKKLNKLNQQKKVLEKELSDLEAYKKQRFDNPKVAPSSLGLIELQSLVQRISIKQHQLRNIEAEIYGRPFWIAFLIACVVGSVLGFYAGVTNHG